ncbi:MAG: hypothetical protein CMIDDMOC_00535 [Sodalis sp. Fle]|nr:MAG: hypothetical protein CMIDDMOC_00535 [Sodalis sp. Fle]
MQPCFNLFGSSGGFGLCHGLEGFGTISTLIQFIAERSIAEAMFEYLFVDKGRTNWL